jgi:hypothetical protein
MLGGIQKVKLSNIHFTINKEVGDLEDELGKIIILCLSNKWNYNI